MPFTGSDIIKIILAIFLPPVGVFMERGCNADFWIDILLTVIGYFPGIIYALYVSACRICIQDAALCFYPSIILTLRISFCGNFDFQLRDLPLLNKSVAFLRRHPGVHCVGLARNKRIINNFNSYADRFQYFVTYNCVRRSNSS